jgi:outer membrane protein assembly factor BamB
MAGGVLSEGFPALAGLQAGSLLAGYRLEVQVGAGGMAVVFRARDQRLDRVVALKVLAPALAADGAFRHRFTAESRAATAVDDPHIIPVYEAGEAGGMLFIAMRFVPGGDLRGVLQREGLLAPARAAEFVSPVASALDAAYGAGLVHRDVKPANILVDARPGQPDHVYLSDFGVSKRAGSSVSLTGGQFLGTPDYSAPEQIEGRPVDGRTDQYALACVAYQLLAGAVPFERDQGMAVLLAHLSAPPPSLTARRPDLPAAADQVLARGMAKIPEERYPSCQDFANSLREALGLAPYHAQRLGHAGAEAAHPASMPTHPQTQVIPPSAGFPGHVSPAADTASTVTKAPPWLAGKAAAGQARAGLGADVAAPAADTRRHLARPLRDRHPRARRPRRAGRVIRHRPVILIAATGIAVVSLVTAIIAIPIAHGTRGTPSRPREQATPGQVRWASDAGDTVMAVAGGTAYAVGNSGTLSALDAATGQVRWTYTTADDHPVATVAAAGSTLYVISTVGMVYALDAATGKARWAYPTRSTIPDRQSVTVSRGTVYISDGDSKVYALNAATGKARWTYTTGGYYNEDPTVAGGTLYVGDAGGTVYALDAATGQFRWAQTSIDTIGPPVVSGGTVYIGEVGGAVDALDTATGKVRWTYTVASQNDSFQAGPAVAGGTVYIGDTNGRVYALDAATGKARWTYATGGTWTIRDSPVVAGATVYVASNKLFALDAATGKARWTYTAGNYVDSPAVAGGIVYVGSEALVYALNTGE